MFQHVQELMISTKVHIAFGYTLILAGVTRVIEICFLPTKSASAVPDGDGHSEQIFADAGSGSEVSGSSDGEKISAPEAFRHLPPFVCLFLKWLSVFAKYALLCSYLFLQGIDMFTITSTSY